jgi:hypothetical protein
MGDNGTTMRPTIGNMPHADLDVVFPSGEMRMVNMIVLLSETLMAEQMAKFGFCQAQNMPTIKKLCEKYELDWFYDKPVKTWKDCAAVMRHIYTVFSDHIAGRSLS